MFQESPPNKANSKDPALLSVSERKALFEKNRGEALVPKAAFAMAVPCPVETTMKVCSTKIMTSKNAGVHKPTVHSSPKKHENVEFPKKPNTSLSVPPPISHSNYGSDTSKMQKVAALPQAKGIVSTMAALLQNKTTISQEQIETSMKSQKEKDMEMLLNRFNRNKGVSMKDCRFAPFSGSIVMPI